MKPIDNHQYKIIAFEILKDFDALCKKYNIKYSLAYGTLLGAVRHKGYIPWDDDIDVIMIREEFERFLDIRDELKQDHTFISLESNNLYSASLAKIYYNKTVLKELMHRDLCDIGVYIDVFVFDYVPVVKWKRKLLYYKALLCRKIWAFSTYHAKTNLLIECVLREYAAKWQLGRKVNLCLNNYLKNQKESSLCCAMMFVYKWDWETFNVNDLNAFVDASNPYGDGLACKRIADVLEYTL